MSDVVMTEKKAGVLSKSMKLVYVYAMATGAIFTFMCYWDGIFMSYTGPATFLAFALMTLAVLPTAFVYAEYSTMLPSTGSCLVFNTVGLNKHAGFWSAWLIMCAWIAVPAAGVLGIIDWLNYQFHLNLVGTKAVIVGALVLCAWFVLVMGIVGVVFPIGTSVLGFWYSGVRMIFAMGRQNFLPKQFSYTNKYNKPILPNILILLVSIGFIAMQSITAFFDLMAFACALCYVITSISSLVADKKHPEWERPYKCAKALKIASLIIMAVIAFFCTIGIKRTTWIGFIGYIGVGALLWLYMIFIKWPKEKVWMKTPDGEKEF